MEIEAKFRDDELDEKQRIALALGTAALLKRLGLAVKDVAIDPGESAMSNVVKVSTENEFPNSIFKQVVLGPLLKKMMDKDAVGPNHESGAPAP